MPNYSFYCTECCGETVENFSLTMTRPQFLNCSECGAHSTAEYRISAPGLTKASYLDGVKRPGFQDGREAMALNREKMAAKSEVKKREIAKEIKKIGVVIEK